MKKTISILLIISMLLIPINVFADSQHYLYIGDSMTYNFATEKHNYTTELGEDNDYPSLLEQEYGFNQDEYEVPVEFLQGGYRTTDVFAFLNDDGFKGDSYTTLEYPYYGIKEEDRANARKAIKDADVITIQLGHSNFASYLVGAIGDVLGFDAVNYDTNLSKIFTQEEINRCKPFVQKAIQDVCLTRMKLPVEINILDAITYAYVSDMVHFDRLLGEIYEINPKAKVYVLGIFNPVPNYYLAYKDFKINAKMLGMVFQPLNDYYKYFAQYAHRYTYIAPPKDVETYSKMFLNDTYSQDEAVEFMAQMLTAQVKDEALAKALAPGALKAFKEGKVDFSLVKDMNVVNDYDYEKLVKPLELKDGEFVNNSDEDIALRETAKLMVITMNTSLMLHPDKKGHSQLFNNIKSVMDKRFCVKMGIYK
ncbi:MAG: hypothetical protein MJ146_05655 [Clostridia bacterium]|nr:hypothetical protein [Clostridia bacterium]